MKSLVVSFGWILVDMEGWLVVGVVCVVFVIGV